MAAVIVALVVIIIVVVTVKSFAVKIAVISQCNTLRARRPSVRVYVCVTSTSATFGLFMPHMIALLLSLFLFLASLPFIALIAMLK